MKFIKQAIFHTFPLLYTLTEPSGSHFLSNKMKHKFLFYNDCELDDSLFGTGFKARSFRVFKFSYSRRNISFFILSYFVVCTTDVDLELDFKNYSQELSDLGLGNGFISFYLCDLYCFVAEKIKCYYNSMCVTTLWGKGNLLGKRHKTQCNLKITQHNWYFFRTGLYGREPEVNCAK